MIPKNLIFKAAFAATFSCVHIAAAAAGTRGAAEQGNEEFPILAWYSIPAEDATEERYRELRDAGFNINFSHIDNFEDAQKSLDLAEKAGMKIVFTCNELAGNPEETVNKVKSHPALAGYFLRDEPVCADFPKLAEWAKKIMANDKGHFCYLNLFPSYVEEGALGDSYRGYVRRFIEEVGLQLVSFDNYPIIMDSVRQGWYENLEIISEESAKAGKPFWAFALATAHNDYPIPDIAQLKLQVYTNLAYGAQGLQYFTYWNPGTETWNFHEAPITLEKKRSPVYDRVREVNKEIQNRAFVFLGSRVVSVRHTGIEIPPGTKRLDILPPQIKTFDTREKGAIVSILENGDYQYLVIVNRSFSETVNIDITFNAEAELVRRDGSIEDADKYESWHQIDKGDAVVFRWKK